MALRVHHSSFLRGAGPLSTKMNSLRIFPSLKIFHCFSLGSIESVQIKSWTSSFSTRKGQYCTVVHLKVFESEWTEINLHFCLQKINICLQKMNFCRLLKQNSYVDNTQYRVALVFSFFFVTHCSGNKWEDRRLDQLHSTFTSSLCMFQLNAN